MSIERRRSARDHRRFDRCKRRERHSKEGNEFHSVQGDAPMSDDLVVSSPPIEAVYRASNANEAIDLGRVAAQCDYQDMSCQIWVDVSMPFAPRAGLHLTCPFEPEVPILFQSQLGQGDGGVSLTLIENGVSFDVLCVSTGGYHHGPVLVPRQACVTVTPPSHGIRHAIVHLLNFPEFLGKDDYTLVSGEQPMQDLQRYGRVVLTCDGWSTTIIATDQTASLAKALRSEGGYALTHLGRIEREDGSAFSSEQLEDMLSCLHYFLSLALGRWAGVALPVGFDDQGHRVFEQWGLRFTADGSWSGSSSWFDQHHGELLSQVFPGFRSLWTSKLWGQPLRHALYWYLGACDRRVGIGVDTGLILGQTALELLSWTYCVLDRKLVPRRMFKPGGLSAAEKLRLLTEELGIPSDIPSELPTLLGLRHAKLNDGPDVITKIRNSLVHPDARGSFPRQAYFEAWKLSLWYVDMVLLRLCGHTGMYANRLRQRWVGEVEPVPWAESEPS